MEIPPRLKMRLPLNATLVGVAHDGLPGPRGTDERSRYVVLKSSRVDLQVYPRRIELVEGNRIGKKSKTGAGLLTALKSLREHAPLRSRAEQFVRFSRPRSALHSSSEFASGRSVGELDR